MLNDANDGLTLDLAVTGGATGQISYRSSSYTESWALSGTWNGQPATLPRTWP